MTKKRLRWGFLTVAIVGGLCALTSVGLALRDGRPPPPPGAAVAVQRGELVEMASVAGTIEPHTQVDIHARVAGEVMEVLVEEGETVEEGQVLFRLDPVDSERALRSAQNEVRRARAALAEARAQLIASQAAAGRAGETARVGERGVELGLTAPETARQSAHDHTVAGADVAVRRAQRESASAQVASAELAVEEAERNLGRSEIRAPFAGTILSVGVERGAIVSSPLGNVSGGTTLMTLADLTDLRVIGQLDESQVGRVDVGQAVRFRVDAYPEREFVGEVHRVSPLGTVDTNVVVFDVEVVVTDPQASLLRSGMSADVEIVTLAHRDVLLVPLTAIRSDGAARAVTLADGQRRRVSTGATDGERIVVLEGLREGERVLRDGREASAPAEAPARRSGLLPGPPGRGGRR